MSAELPHQPNSSYLPSDDKSELLDSLEALWKEASDIWDSEEHKSAFRDFVAADYRAVHDALVGLQGRADTVLEWGSGLGVIAITASLLGFQAYGIEIEPQLIGLSRDLATKYGSNAIFAEGSFVPEEYDWNREFGDEHFRTRIDEASGYNELDMRLSDFDVVYSYPWPEEQNLHRDIMKQCGGRNSIFLTFNVTEGISKHRMGRKRSGNR